MLWRLQRKTIVPSQIAGYFLTLFIGVSIIVIAAQLYWDLKPLWKSEQEIFKNHASVVSKNVSIFKTFNKEGIYFTPKELNDFKRQEFVREVAVFQPATFTIKAYKRHGGDIPDFYMDLFFESIPDKYLDVTTDDWTWDESSDQLPIIVPENYLNLYNFGFAESQGLPVFSQNTVSQVEFNIRIAGKGKRREYIGRIVGFSDKINSILVPKSFMDWANQQYGSSIPRISRVLVEFSNPADDAILEFFNENNYAISKSKLETGKLSFFLKLILLFVFVLAAIIVVLAIGFILMSFNLILQRNKALISNLYNLGYSLKKIGFFYKMLIAGITVVGILAALISSFVVRGLYMESLTTSFDLRAQGSIAILVSLGLCILFVTLFYFLIPRYLKKTIG